MSYHGDTINNSNNLRKTTVGIPKKKQAAIDKKVLSGSFFFHDNEKSSIKKEK